MQSINEIMYGMTAQERDLYLAHQSKRAREELEKVEWEKQQLKIRKAGLIEDILKTKSDRFTFAELQKKPVRVLERIAWY